jgi:hypothetical protein
MGPIHVDITRTGFGYAPVTATLADGEVLKGTARAAFGTAMAQGVAIGPSGTHTAMGFGMTDGNLQMTLTGPKTQMLCRGYANLMGHGSGECRTYDGAAWTVSY